jgi:hypothetical protein
VLDEQSRSTEDSHHADSQSRSGSAKTSCLGEGSRFFFPLSTRPRPSRGRGRKLVFFFSEVGEEPFFVARNVVLSGAAKARADLLALDHNGSAVVVVCAGDDREFLLARGITAVSILAGWKPENFVERLAESSAGSLACFLRTGESKINTSQRLVFVAERFDRETLSAVEWLAQQGAIEVACWQGVRVPSTESDTPCFRLEQVFPAAEPGPAAAETKLAWRSLERWLPQRLPARNLGRLGTAAMALLLIFTGWRYGVASYPKDLSPAANTLKETLPLAMPGRVLDASTGQPVAGAKVFHAGRLLATDATGQFKIEPRGNKTAVLVKAAGYRQAEFALAIDDQGVLALRLEPLEVRALYLSYDNLPNAERRDKVLDLIRQTRSNSIIVGVKDASGYLSLAVDHELARKTRAFDPLRGPALAAMVQEWKSQGLYTIALVCLFKDDLLADSMKSFALRGAHSKAVIRDRYGVAWVDPSSEAVQEYNLQAAKAAAEAGFDEIQFDFVRYPAEAASREGLTPQENQRRLAIVSEFLTRAANLLAPYNVYLGASVFGSVCWMRDVSVIGQDLGSFAAALDYVSPMLYPSSFGPGEDSPVPVPMRNPYEVVSNSLLAAIKRLDGNARQLRPWLQNFPHDLTSRIPLRADQIRAQVKAAQDARASGWMLWDSGNSYPNTVEALRGLPIEVAESAGRRVTD